MSKDNQPTVETGVFRKLSELVDLPKLIDLYNEKVWPILSLIWLKKINYWVLGRNADIQSGQKVLEVGSGVGTDYKALAGKVGEKGVYVALDINKPIQEKSKRSYLFWLAKNEDSGKLESGRASHVVSDAVHDLPFEENTFDTVVSSNFTGMSRKTEDNTLFGTKGWDYVEEAHRVLKPGGKIVASWGEFIIPISSIFYLRKLKKAGFVNAKLRPGTPALFPLAYHWILTGEKEKEA